VFRNRPVSLALVGLFLWVTGCTSYKQIQLAEVADHGEVRVTTIDGERATVHDPRVEADSIKGHVNEGAEQFERTISAGEVLKVEVAAPNTVGTVLIVIGSLAAIVFVVAAVQCNGVECG
jgi:hypothetical protein